MDVQKQDSSSTTRPSSHRTVKLVSVGLIAALCLVLFVVKWLVIGEAPWRAAAMAGILVAVLVVLRLIEPSMRKRAQERRDQQRQQLMHSVEEPRDDDLLAK